MNQTNYIKVIVGALGVAIVASALLVGLTSNSAEATDAEAPQSASSPQFSVLAPATPDRVAALPEQSRLLLDFVSASVLPGNDKALPVTALGSSSANDSAATVALAGNAVCAFYDVLAACNERDLVAAGKGWSARPDACDGYLIVGVVPDGIAAVAIDSGRDGTVNAKLPVTGNAYHGIVAAVDTVATGLTDASEPVFETGMPLDYFAATNGACR